MFDIKMLEVVLKVKFNGDLYHFEKLDRHNRGPGGAVPVLRYLNVRHLGQIIFNCLLKKVFSVFFL